GIGHHLEHHSGDDLPRNAVAVFQPPARLRLSALEKRVPVAIDFRLILAIHYERNSVVERIHLASSHRSERLAEQLELDDFYGSRRAARRFAGHRRYADNTGVRKDRGIELGGLLGFLGSTEARGDYLRTALLG